MNNRPDLESRLRAYLSSGARTQAPSGMEGRIAARVLGRRYSWAFQPGDTTSDFSVEIYRTSDGGRNWSRTGTSVAGWGFPGAIDFVDRQHGWLLMKQDGTLQTPGSDMLAIYGTADGGASWSKLSETDTSGLAGHLPLACSKTNLVFVTATTGWIQGGCGAGGGYFLYVTRDGGRNWAGVSLRIPDRKSTRLNS